MRQADDDSLQGSEEDDTDQRDQSPSELRPPHVENGAELRRPDEPD